MRIGFFVPLVAIVLIVGGGQMSYTGLTNRKPHKVEMSSLVQSKPDAKWLNIEGGEFDVINSSYSSAFGVGDASKIHVPLVLPGDDSTEKEIHVLVETSDPELVKLVNQIKEMENHSEDEIIKFMFENRDKLRKSRPVAGIVKFGMESGKEERKIKGMYSNLAPDVVLLKEGERPDAIVGILMFSSGIIVLVLIIKTLLKPKDPTDTPPPLPTDGTPPPLPPSV
ncbi:MAG: hypothetical protein V4727_01575 [Verrucomicrobiota bacterium]